jgi:hypothetical protein
MRCSCLLALRTEIRRWISPRILLGAGGQSPVNQSERIEPRLADRPRSARTCSSEGSAKDQRNAMLAAVDLILRQSNSPTIRPSHRKCKKSFGLLSSCRFRGAAIAAKVRRVHATAGPARRWRRTQGRSAAASGRSMNQRGIVLTDKGQYFRTRLSLIGRRGSRTVSAPQREPPAAG